MGKVAKRRGGALGVQVAGSSKREPKDDGLKSWGVAVLVASAALIGLVILVLVVAFALQPPAWAQILVGVLIVVGAVSFAWLLQAALRSSRDDESRRR
jgi:uncharacterized membrane protein YqjE